MSLFKSLRTLVGILFGTTPLWTSKEEIMPENSIESVGLIKYESIFIGVEH